MLPPSADYQVLSLRTRDGTPIAAQFGAPLDAGGRPKAGTGAAPTVVFFYGNGAYAAAMAPEFLHLRLLGANALIVEYPGYGMGGGHSGEQAFYAAADAAYDYLEHRPDIDHGRIVAAGWSMGAAVALDLAARHKVAGLVIVSAFTTLPATAAPSSPGSRRPSSSVPGSTTWRRSAPWPAPSSSSTATATRSSQRMSGELEAAARTKVTSLTIEGAGHNDVFEKGGDTLWRAVGSLVVGPR